MKVAVSSMIGVNCVTTEDGDQLFTKIKDIFGNGGEVTLDFSGVQICASPFLNASVGQSIAVYGSDFVASHLHCVGMNFATEAILERVIANSTRFPKGDPRLTQLISGILDGDDSAI